MNSGLGVGVWSGYLLMTFALLLGFWVLRGCGARGASLRVKAVNHHPR